MPKTRQSTTVTRRVPIQSGGSETTTVRTLPQSRQDRPSRPVRDYGPTRIADKSSSGVGLLEAEFFGIIFLLILQLFIGKGDYGSKMLSFMKRGTLSAILFFFLALIAGAGDNAAKISKAIGALVFVAILLSSPGSDVINALDGLFKADWTGESSANSSSDSGTQQSTTGAIANASGKGGTAQANAYGAAERALKDAQSSLGNLLLTPDIPRAGFDLITAGVDGLTNTYKRVFGFLKRIP